MQAITTSRIHSYRFAGCPRRGMLELHASTKRLISDVRTHARQAKNLSAESLKESAQQIRAELTDGADINDRHIVVRAFALMTESLRRETGMVYYDVQLAGGLALASGCVAQIQTGEGKTITTALPAMLFGLAGKGVHVGTTNEYLSLRDHDELAGAYRALGLSTGHLKQNDSPDEKAKAYSADITYGPGYEFGFDFLRDQLVIRGQYQEPLGQRYLRSLSGIKTEKLRLAQRGHVFAVIDEADSVLIDEATTPLILSGLSAGPGFSTSPEVFHFANEVACALSAGTDYEIDDVKLQVNLTTAGWTNIHREFQNRPPGKLSRRWSLLIENALRAQHIFDRDVDYVVKDDQIMIVDQNTGRIHDERTWSNGLHQAVEVKEGVSVTAENDTQARITRQRYCQFYQRICGLTGTASGAESELRDFYGLPVVTIPTNRPCLRKELPMRVFASSKAKLGGITAEIANRQRTGQPILVGTQTIHESKTVSNLLRDIGVKHVVLNGLQDEEEAKIIADAGAAGRVTVATNMAGRGTDICLPRESKDAGGLHVIATEFHNSSRVDRQLAGRAARQGDPGSCQFFASAEDEMIAVHNPALATELKEHADESGEYHGNCIDQIKQTQNDREHAALVSRRQIVEHDHWLESIQSALARRA